MGCQRSTECRSKRGRRGCWAAGMHKGYGWRASSEEHSTFLCWLLHREQVQAGGYLQAVLCTGQTGVMKITHESWIIHLCSTRTTLHLTRKQRTYGTFLCSRATGAAEMWSCITDFFTYETTKSVVVKSWTIGIINRIVQLIIITYFIGWVLQALPVIFH